ncbi:hypothetical protein GQR58_029724 [Nymphon striatum]|nr:hypothetical protein GQR58_029724 [Nymphon striatum]
MVAWPLFHGRNVAAVGNLWGGKASTLPIAGAATNSSSMPSASTSPTATAVPKPEPVKVPTTAPGAGPTRPSTPNRRSHHHRGRQQQPLLRNDRWPPPGHAHRPNLDGSSAKPIGYRRLRGRTGWSRHQRCPDSPDLRPGHQPPGRPRPSPLRSPDASEAPKRSPSHGGVEVGAGGTDGDFGGGARRDHKPHGFAQRRASRYWLTALHRGTVGCLQACTWCCVQRVRQEVLVVRGDRIDERVHQCSDGGIHIGLGANGTGKSGGVLRYARVGKEVAHLSWREHYIVFERNAAEQCSAASHDGAATRCPGELGGVAGVHRGAGASGKRACGVHTPAVTLQVHPAAVVAERQAASRWLGAEVGTAFSVACAHQDCSGVGADQGCVHVAATVASCFHNDDSRVGNGLDGVVVAAHIFDWSQPAGQLFPTHPGQRALPEDTAGFQQGRGWFGTPRLRLPQGALG